MILYSLIIRTADGMALSASTDFSNEINKNIKDSKRYVKLIAKKASQFPDRCSLCIGSYTIHFITAIGITFLALCDANYPVVLGFSFLDELMKEFITRYNREKINEVRRPYSFIEFDSFIHKARQRYNKPQSLSSRINISDLSLDIRLNPPKILSINEIEPPMLNGYKLNPNLDKISVGPPAKLAPLPWYAVISTIPTVFLSIIDFYRGISALSEGNIEEYDGPSTFHGCFFLMESLLRIYQVNLIFSRWRHRTLQSTACLVFLCLFEWSLMELRDLWMIIICIASAIGMHIICVKRHLEPKLPDYNV